MYIEDTPFVTYRRRGRYREDPNLEEIKLEDTNSKDQDMTYSQIDRVKGTIEDEDKIAFNDLISAINDLIKGQKEVLNAVNRLEEKPR